MKTIPDLDTLISSPTPQDVIGAIFAYSNLETFPSDRKRLHNFIRREKTGDAAELLEPLVFSKGVDLYPFSRLLESVLMQLQLGGWLSAKNPEYDRFGMTEETRNMVIERIREVFSPGQLATLEKVGRDFHEEFATRER